MTTDPKYFDTDAIIVRETEKAVLLDFSGGTRREPMFTRWVPKSQVNQKLDGAFQILQVSAWFVRKNGIRGLVI